MMASGRLKKTFAESGGSFGRNIMTSSAVFHVGRGAYAPRDRERRTEVIRLSFAKKNTAALEHRRCFHRLCRFRELKY
jgi:hypothetical protein